MRSPQPSRLSHPRSRWSKCVSGTVCACLLWLCWNAPTTWAQTIADPTYPQVFGRDDLFDRLTVADAIYLGEVHSRGADRQAQLEILQQLHDRNPNLAIGMEMFPRSQQGAIDRYLAGELDETEFVTETRFNETWGFPWVSYAPLLRFAKTHSIPVIALNAPIAAVREVAVGGFENISAEYRADLPPIEEFRTDNAAYRERLREIYDSYHQGHGSSDGFENFFKAQILWDETMSDRVAQYLSTHPDTSVVVIAGQGHIVYGDGIPSRVARRIPDVEQVLLLFEPDETLPSTPERPLADIIWRYD